MDILLEKEIEHVRVVNPDRKYWFIRTYGGELYENFYQNNYVGLGFNEVPYEYIRDFKGTAESFKKIQGFINNNTEYKKGEATKWARQLIEFEHEVKIDDMVIIPSKGSHKLAFGIVRSSTILIKSPGQHKIAGEYVELPQKRKKIEWVRVYDKYDFQGELRGLLSSHQALTRADFFSQLLESSLTSIYIKNELVYLTLKVDQEEDINAFELQRFLTGLTYFYKEYCTENGIEVNEDLTIKIKLQSKGKLAVSTPFIELGLNWQFKYAD